MATFTDTKYMRMQANPKRASE